MTLDTLKSRQDEATSDETLDELEEDEFASDYDEDDDSAGLSPDGAFDEDDELEDADPV